MSPNDRDAFIRDRSGKVANAHILILYKLKPEVQASEFEAWLRTTDFPALRQMKHVRSFTTYGVTKRVMDGGAAPVDYVDIYDVPDIQRFLSEDLATGLTQQVMAEIRGFVEAAEYWVARPVGA